MFGNFAFLSHRVLFPSTRWLSCVLKSFGWILSAIWSPSKFINMLFLPLTPPVIPELFEFRVLVAGAHTLHTPMSRSWVFGRTCWGSTVCLESKPCPPPSKHKHRNHLQQLNTGIHLTLSPYTMVGYEGCGWQCYGGHLPSCFVTAIMACFPCFPTPCKHGADMTFFKML